MHDQTCLSVQWAWKAFPAFVVLLAVIFFIARVIVTRPIGSKVPIWKSSPLPLLSHDLDLPQSLQMSSVGDGGHEELEDMEKFAKHIIVRLQQIRQNLMFVQSVD